jgi:hypothetical protein
LVLDAARALHRDGRARPALKLVERYLREYPLGALEEEALALVIEAKSALRDSSVTATARSYLGRFPEGRFRDLAVSALAGADR